MKDPYPSLKELTKICLLTDLTLMPAWSFEEAGQILETYKSYEFKPPDMIMEKLDSDPYSKASDHSILILLFAIDNLNF